jgi:hypothetical protein
MFEANVIKFPEKGCLKALSIETNAKIISRDWSNMPN